MRFRTSMMLLAAVLLSARVCPAEEAKAPAEDEPSRVTLHVKDAALGDVLREISTQTGNPAVDVADDLRGRKVSLDLDGKTCWQALDALCDAAKLLYDVDRATGKMVLRAVGTGRDAGVASGPVSVRLSGTQTNWWYSQSPAPALSCDLIFFWEGRLPVASAQACVTRILSPQGDVLLSRRPEERTSTSSALNTGGGPGRRFSFGVQDVPRGLDHLAQVEGVVTLTLGAGEKTLTVPHLLVEGGRTVTADDLTIAVKSARKEADALLCHVTVARDGVPVELVLGPPAHGFGVFLLDDGSKRSPGIVFPGSYAPRPHVIDAMRQGGLDMQFSTVRGGGSYTLCFLEVPDAKDLSLVLVRPETVTTREYPFVLENLPLP